MTYITINVHDDTADKVTVESLKSHRDLYRDSSDDPEELKEFMLLAFKSILAYYGEYE